MSINWPKPSYNHVQEYQVSSWPWVTSSSVGTSATYYGFSHVSSWIVVCNEETGASKDIYFGFTQNGTNGSNHFHVLPGTVVGPVELKCSGVWVKSNQAGGAAFSIMAGLTNVVAGDFPTITGSNGFGGVG